MAVVSGPVPIHQVGGVLGGKTPATEGHAVKNFPFVCISSCIVVLSFIGCNGSRNEPMVPVITASPVIQSNPDMVVTDTIRDMKKPTTLEDRFSYTYGYMLYSTMKQQGFDTLSGSFFAKGALDAESGSGFYSQQEMSEILYEVQTKLLAKAQTEIDKLASDNLKEAEAFLALNKEQHKVQTTDSGLQFEVMTQGEGEMPSEESVVEVDYRIMLLNGKIIDSSYDRGHSSTFQLKAIMVAGFIEGVKLMHSGSTYRFWIHPDLAYGKEGSQTIEPNSLLIVDVELKSVKSAQ